MASEQFSYNGSTTLSQACGLNDLTVTVNNASATGLPTIPNFRIKIDAEEMLVTAVNLGTNVYTVTRATEGTIQATHANGAPVVVNLTPAALTTAFQRIDQGINGANSGRFVGQFTFSGAPTSGTWQLADYGYDSNGVLYLNVAAGTPGTWRSVGGWIKWSRFIVGTPVPDTSSVGDITIPAGFNHAMFMWTAQDTSANNNASFGGMQLASGGGAIDQGNNYNWVDNGKQSNPFGDVSGFGINVASWGAFVTSGGNVGGQYWSSGTIWLPFYSRTDITTRGHWQTLQINPADSVARAGSGYHTANGAALTKVRFFSNVNNFATNTTFDLYVSP